MASNTADATSASNNSKPLYQGSCHCGFVKYTANIDLVNPSPQMGGVFSKCNCSLCHKSGCVLAIPESDSITVVSPPEGRSALKDYKFASEKMHHWLCPKCGIKCFLDGEFVYEGKEFKFARVNVLTLDGKVDGSPMEDLRQIKPVYWDGKGIRWEGDVLEGAPTAAAKEPFEGGMW